MKKGSMGFNFLVVLLITLAFVLIYFVWMRDYRIFGENLSDYTICKNSNMESAKLRLKINNQVIDQRRGNKCKTEYIEVPKGDELEITAKKMANCWDMYLEGKEELFETTDNNYCAICSVLTYKNKEDTTGLTSYLMETKIPYRSETYYHYLTNTFVTNEIFSELENSELGKLDKLDGSRPQAVIFVMGKDANPGSFTGQSSVVNAAGGSAIGSVAASLAVVTGYGLCATGVGCLLGAFIVGAGVGGTTGYLIGSDYNPDLNTRILLWPYTNEDLRQLDCTVLEGQDTLEIKKF